MQTVILACIPGLIAQLYFFGTGVIIQLVLALLTASISEAIIMLIRKRPVWPALSDGSAWLTAVLLALSIPPLAPWWVIVIGSFFAIVIVKQLYGGLGFNLFNPAMAAYVLLLISFPVQMTTWMPVSDLLANPISFSQQLSVVFNGFTSGGFSVDQLRGLDKLGFKDIYIVKEQEKIDPNFTNAPKPNPEERKALELGIGYLKNRNADIFIATDPVSAATTNRGRLIYGALIGLLVYLIRTFGGYPDAMAFAVLLLNMAVPLIDYYTQPRTYGHGVNK